MRSLCTTFATAKNTIREMAAEKRDLYFDSLKLVLIVFVVIGHAMEQLGGVLT